MFLFRPEYSDPALNGAALKIPRLSAKSSTSMISYVASICLGINMEGWKDNLGLWIGESEGAKAWLKVCTEMHHRQIEDILIACMDRSKALPDAIKSVFPDLKIQICVIHSIRHSVNYVPIQYAQKFLGSLKKVYEAVPVELELSQI